MIKQRQLSYNGALINSPLRGVVGLSTFVPVVIPPAVINPVVYNPLSLQTGGILSGYGTQTLINGYAVRAYWSLAQLSRIHQYLDASQWAYPTYELVMPASVLQSPYNLHNSAEIQHGVLGWKLVVRHIDAPHTSLERSFVHVIAVVVPNRSSQANTLYPTNSGLMYSNVDLLFSGMAYGYGSPTLVNGNSVSAFWCEGELNRIQQYLNAGEEHYPSYEVALPAIVFQPPYNIHNAEELVDVVNNVRCDIRNVDAPTGDDAIQFVHVVTVVLPRPGDGT